MSLKTKVSQHTFSDLEKVTQELTRLLQENMELKMELLVSKALLKQHEEAARLESKSYLGIKKYFR